MFATMNWPDNGPSQTMPSKKHVLYALVDPVPTPVTAELPVLPPGPKGLFRRPFIAIAGLRRHHEYKRKRLMKKEGERQIASLISPSTILPPCSMAEAPAGHMVRNLPATANSAPRSASRRRGLATSSTATFLPWVLSASIRLLQVGCIADALILLPRRSHRRAKAACRAQTTPCSDRRR